MKGKKQKPVKKLKDFRKPILKPGTPTDTADLATGSKIYYNNWEVRPAGNYNEVYSPNGYSKHMERWKAYQEGKIKSPEQIYGLPQALDHIAELRQDESLKNAEFEVVEVTIIKTSYKVNKL